MSAEKWRTKSAPKKCAGKESAKNTCYLGNKIMYKNKPIKKIALFICLIFVVFVSFAKVPLYVEVFTDSAHSVNVSDVSDESVVINYCKLDDADKFSNSINSQLKNLRNHNTPKKILLQQAKQLFIGNKVKLKQAYFGLFLAANYRLKKYPAIVFDHGKAVIYGQPDLAQAISEYKKWQH